MKKIIALLFIIMLVGCGKGKKDAKGKEKGAKEVKEVSYKTVKIKNISKGSITRNNTSSGIIDPENEVEHITETGGDIIGINYKNGEKVSKGDIIIILKDTDIESAYLSAEADFLSANSDYDTKEINYNKFESLYAESLVSEDEYLTVKNLFNQCMAVLKKAEASYIKAKEDKENLIMKSKIDGVITGIDVKLYQKINSDTSMFTVVDDSVMRIETGVSGKEINSLKLGSKATINVDGVEELYDGIVYEIDPVADETTKKYQVKIEVENPKGELKKGMYSKVLIETGEKIGYVVPKQAIVIKELYSYVFILNGDEAKKVKVQNGYTQGSFQEIISEDLPTTFDLIVEGQFLLDNKEKVKVVK